MQWKSQYLKSSTISETTQTSTFFTKTPLTHNNMSLAHTHFPVPIPHFKPNLMYITRDLTSPLNGQPYLASFTPTGNYTRQNKTPKLVSYIYQLDLIQTQFRQISLSHTNMNYLTTSIINKDDLHAQNSREKVITMNL